MEDKEILRKTELAQLLDVTTQTIDTYIKDGMPCIGRERRRRFIKEEVIEWLRKQGKGGEING